MLKTAELYDMSHTLAGAYLSGFEYPWQALKGIKELILALGPTLGEDYTEVSPTVWVHRTAAVAPTAFLGAPCIIGAGTLLTQHKKIPPNSLVMGAPGAVVRPLREEEIEKIAKNAEHYYTMSREHMRGEFQLAPQREENDA